MSDSLADHENTVAQLTDLFAAVADATRLRILLLVFDAEQRSGQIADALAMTPSAVSHQLRWLRERRIVAARKQGRETYYRLADDCIRDLLSVALQHVAEESRPRGTPPSPSSRT